MVDFTLRRGPKSSLEALTASQDPFTTLFSLLQMFKFDLSKRSGLAVLKENSKISETNKLYII